MKFNESIRIRMYAQKRKGSLIYGIIAFAIALIVLLTFGVLVPFAHYRLQSVEREFAGELQSRIDILLSGIATGVKMYMPSADTVELHFMVNQLSTMSDLEFVTVVGCSIEDERNHSYSEGQSSKSYLHVWSTSDENILEKIDTDEFLPGISRLASAQFVELDAFCRDLNTEIYTTVKENYILPVGSASTDADFIVNLNHSLDEFAVKNSASNPVFDVSHIQRDKTSYLFYRPIIYYLPNASDFVHGLVLVGIDTSSLVSSIGESRVQFQAVIIVVAALTFFICALVFIMIARYIVRPIKSLESFALKIASEKHREKLLGKGKDIRINRNDELGRLGDAMNRLKEALASDAIRERLMNDGKTVQKAFLPLDKTKSGLAQKTTASYYDERIYAFGYYEGASDVSGDYFDYRRLNERWYAFIKSDVSGHGTPAALIMTVVATLFNKFFDEWSDDSKDITSLVYQINDYLESLPLTGKFATIILILYDSETDRAYMCNAGDNVTHIYRAKKSCMETLYLKESPAAGLFSSYLINENGGFVQEEETLEHGDTLFLYTDGLEDSTRLVRDGDYQVVQGIENGRLVEKSEVFGGERVRQIIEAVFSRSQFVLKKMGGCDEDDDLVFDFGTCEGTCDDAIIALVSIEKVFRMYKSRFVAASNTILVDRKIDVFLKNHFNLYEKYCSPVLVPEDGTESEYVVYSHILEDEQRDDLTIFAVKHP